MHCQVNDSPGGRTILGEIDTSNDAACEGAIAARVAAIVAREVLD